MAKPITFAYPADLKEQEDGSYLVTFPDLPEALTEGADFMEAVFVEAEDCLAEAIAARIADGEDIPVPSRATPEQTPIPLDPVIAAKAALYARMRAEGISKVELAKRLKVHEKEVRRMLDPRHQTRIRRIEKALAALGKRLTITVSDAA
jgi:antitoxin HicB